jgi:hypothetical protein
MAIGLPFDTQIVGDSLNSKGFEAYQTVEGLGLNTFGFLWPIQGIWAPDPGSDIPSTAWVLDPGATIPMTVWAADPGSSIAVTGWTNTPDCVLNGFY